jgi:hypothetical protein
MIRTPPSTPKQRFKEFWDGRGFLVNLKPIPRSKGNRVKGLG